MILDKWIYTNKNLTAEMEMDIRLLSRKYAVRKLNINDVDIIYDMSYKNEIFYKYHPPFVTKKVL